MFAAKGKSRPAAAPPTASGSRLKRPSTLSSAASTASSASSSGSGSSSTRRLGVAATPTAKRAAAAAPSAAAAGGGLQSARSASRSSILSDTTASVCSASSAAHSLATSCKSAAAPSNGRATAATPSIKRTVAAPLLASGRRQSSFCSTVRSPSFAAPKATLSSSSTVSISSPSSRLAPTTSGSGGPIKRTPPTVAVTLRDKDQQIKLLIKERDEQKFQAELMARKVDEWREKYEASELERSHVTSEADDEVVELRRLAQEFEDENKSLAKRLAEREQAASDAQFKLDECEIEKNELKRELEFKEEQLVSMETERQELCNGQKTSNQVVTERAISKAKYEREIEDLKEKILCRDEQMIQLRTSLEMRKNEVSNLQAHSSDLERKLKIESERSERHLKRLDEINLELKAADAKLTTKGEENEMLDKQVRQLRQELRSAEEKLEQLSLARKRDVDILHNKLSAARRGSTTPTSPQPFKTPTPQDEIVRFQMEIRDLKDQLIDREAELDCNRRDLEVIKRKMETRTLEVDCNNQELARRCQDLLEQNRQSEDTVKQLLKSTTEHSAQLMRATEDLKEANAKCIQLRELVNELEKKLEAETSCANKFRDENQKLEERNSLQREQIEMLHQQIESLNEQISELCDQLDMQTNSLHKDREALANQLSQHEIDLAQLRHDLATARQDLRTSKLQTQEMLSERDRLRSDLDIKEKYVRSRNDIIENMRHELDDGKKSLCELKQKLEATRLELETSQRGTKTQVDSLRDELKAKGVECDTLRLECEELAKKFEQFRAASESEADEKFAEMRQKHSAEIDELKLKIKSLQEELGATAAAGEAASDDEGGTLKRNPTRPQRSQAAEQEAAEVEPAEKQKRDEYETQIEFLNSVVVDMQRKCDDYKNQLAQIETESIVNEFDNLILASDQQASRTSTLKSAARSKAAVAKQPLDATLPRPTRVVRIQDPASGVVSQRAARISGRPYCDICNLFDLHHTVYCPKVSQKLAAAAARNYSTAANNNNNNGVSNNNFLGDAVVDEMFREYEQSLTENSVAAKHQFASLRRVAAPRAYCDQCDEFGHSIKNCCSLKL